MGIAADDARDRMTCHWCGDPHGVDQLCQRAQRGMTRRSFCFLFGAGVAGAALAPSLNTPNWYRDFNGDLHVFQADSSTMIEESISGPAYATFKTRDHWLREGQAIEIQFADRTIFRGIVEAPSRRQGRFFATKGDEFVIARSNDSTVWP